MSDESIIEQSTENKEVTVAHASTAKPWLWKPGQSGNPGGRPKKLTRILENVLDAKDAKGVTKAEKLIKAAVDRAIRKSDFLVKEVWDRTEGKMVESKEDAGGIQVVVITRND